MTVTARSVMPARTPAPGPRSRRRGRLPAAVLALVLALTAAPAVAGPARSAKAPGPGSEVIAQWNQIALRTVYTEAGTSVPRGGLPMGIVQLAVYDAVVAVEGGYETYLPQPRAQAQASSEVAAVTAAYRVLRSMYATSAATLDADYAATMATLPKGVGRVHGIRVGEAAAAAMLASRIGDGRTATVSLPLVTPPVPAGVWQPTPTAFAPMQFAELGFVRPLVLASPTALPVPGPDALTSAAYTADYDEVTAYGARDGSLRTAEQSATAVFWNANAAQQFHLAMGTEVIDRDLGIVEGARAFAMLGAATGDAAIACWRAKHDYAYWRPVTAIRLGDSDGNPATVGDPAWTPLLNTPPYPDYPSGHGCFTGAASGVFGHLFGDGSIDIEVPSLTATAPARHFVTTAELDEETMDARIWLGFHFRRAMTDANALGHAVTDVVAPRFDPVG